MQILSPSKPVRACTAVHGRQFGCPDASTEDMLKTCNFVRLNIWLSLETEVNDAVGCTTTPTATLELNCFGDHSGAGSALFNWEADRDVLYGACTAAVALPVRHCAAQARVKICTVTVSQRVRHAFPVGVNKKMHPYHKPLIATSLLHAGKGGLYLDGNDDNVFSFESGSDWDIDIDVFPNTVPMMVDFGIIQYHRTSKISKEFLLSTHPQQVVTADELRCVTDHQACSPKDPILVCYEIPNIVSALLLAPVHVMCGDRLRESPEARQLTGKDGDLLRPWHLGACKRVFVEQLDGNEMMLICEGHTTWTYISWGTS